MPVFTTLAEWYSHVNKKRNDISLSQLQAHEEVFRNLNFSGYANRTVNSDFHSL